MRNSVKNSIIIAATLSMMQLGISHAAGTGNLTFSGTKFNNNTASNTGSSNLTENKSPRRWKSRPAPTPEPTPEFKAPPKGFYHSAGAIKSQDQRASVTSDMNGRNYVSGTLVRMNWSLINTSEGVFDFSLIERELEQAALYNTSISLAIMDSKSMPQYVLDKCETFDYEFRAEAAQTCLPWDAVYQQYKAQLVSKLGAQFDSHPNLAGIYFTYAAMSNGIEMHFRVDEDAFRAAGYTASRLADSYDAVMDMYADAFKTTSVIMEVHEVFKESYLAESAFDHCYDTLGARCGVAIWWCASRMATDPKESEYKVYPVAQKATELSFAVCQTVGNFTDQPDRFDQGQGWTTEEAFSNEMDFFVGEGFKTFELWSKDITNDNLVDIINKDVLPNL